jgi:hypothetical protein
MNTRRFPRSLSEAFPDVRASCGDDIVARAILNHHRITVRDAMPKLPRHRPHVICTDNGLLARLWRWVRGWFK